MNRLASTLASAAVLIGLLTSSRPAHAQGTAGTSGAGSTFTEADFFVGIQKQMGTNMSLYDQARFFNKKECDCTTPVWVYVSLTNAGFAKRRSVPMTGTFSVLIGGSQCADPIYRNTCLTIASYPTATFMAQGRDTFPTNARAMSTTTTSTTVVDGGTFGGGIFVPTPNCQGTITSGFDQNIWILVDTSGDGSAETQVKFPVHIDLVPPPPPTLVDVQPGNEAMIVSWTPIDFATNMDLAGYQVFCRRAADLPVFKAGTYPSYVKACDPDPMVFSGPEGLDERFACSPLLTRSTSSYRVKILQNGIGYGATVVAVDNSGNGSTPEVLETVPKTSLSFYEYYRRGDINGQADGGFCAVAATERSDARPLAGAGVAAGALVALVLRARRRRRGS